MSFLVTASESELLPETLPALKLTQFYAEPARGRVYSYLRCYVCRGSLNFTLTVFDGFPKETARIGLAVSLCEDAAKYLFLSCAKQGVQNLQLYENNVCTRQLELPGLQFSSGGDEQGLYWSVQGVLPAALFKEVFGTVPKTGMILPGNVFLYDETESAFGAAFPAKAGMQIPSNTGFGSFMIVPY